MEIKESSEQVLQQLIGLIEKLNNEQFTRPLSLLSGNTIGKHIRHIIELYDQLILGYVSGIINYDERKREIRTETDPKYAIYKLEQIIIDCNLQPDKPVQLMLDYSINNQVNNTVTSSYKRELAYNIEHAVHHMAILKMAIENYFDEIVLGNTFGIAASTLRYQKECAQ